MRARFEELMADPCCASCDCDGLTSDVAVYLDHKTCDAERCRRRDDPTVAETSACRPSLRALHEGQSQG